MMDAQSSLCIIALRPDGSFTEEFLNFIGKNWVYFDFIFITLQKNTQNYDKHLIEHKLTQNVFITKYYIKKLIASVVPYTTDINYGGIKSGKKTQITRSSPRGVADLSLSPKSASLSHSVNSEKIISTAVANAKPAPKKLLQPPSYLLFNSFILKEKYNNFMKYIRNQGARRPQSAPAARRRTSTRRRPQSAPEAAARRRTSTRRRRPSALPFVKNNAFEISKK
jgi:hypothetical protein